jgi:uncharacterized membrane protein required for colicin V production
VGGEVRVITRLDWIILGIVALAALSGFRRGIIATVLALVGLVVGAVVGARLAPHFLAAGASSRYTALVGLSCAVAGIAVFQLLAGLLARTIRGGLRLLPPLRLVDSLGGLAFGALFGLALVWVAGAVALQVPGHPQVRRAVRQSEVLERLDRVASPRDILLVQSPFASLRSLLGARRSG